jgi:AraC-like DNA-binding protein
MNFQERFLNSLQTDILTTKTNSILDNLPLSSISVSDEIKENLTYLMGYGSYNCNYPYYYEISGLDTYCLLYTESGSGTFIHQDSKYVLNSGTLAIIDCQMKHRIEIRQSFWDYKVLFFAGKSVSFLYDKIIADNGFVFDLSPVSSVPDMVNKLFTQLYKNPDNIFIQSRFILDILIELIVDKSRLAEYKLPIPGYLIQLKSLLDNNYQNSFTLSILEKEFKKSRFRICRDFNEYYNNSPIRYLNQRRIEAAKEALIHTDKKINEIGRMVGFENTNHFIKQFKQHTGITPLDFRKQTPPLIF